MLSFDGLFCEVEFGLCLIDLVQGKFAEGRRLHGMQMGKQLCGMSILNPSLMPMVSLINSLTRVSVSIRNYIRRALHY